MVLTVALMSITASTVVAIASPTNRLLSRAALITGAATICAPSLAMAAIGTSSPEKTAGNPAAV